MEELVKYIVTGLVNNPDQVCITRVDNQSGYTIQVQVAPEDMGKIIGRQGRIARAIRTVVKSKSASTGEKVTVEII